MSSNLRWKVIVAAGVLVLFAAVGIYPIAASQFRISTPQFLIARRLKLGLDLEGGVHLVLRVQTDDALRIETERELDRVREALRQANMPVARIMMTNPSQFEVEGVPQEREGAFQEATAEAQTNFDRSSGARGTYAFTLKPAIEGALREEAVVQARQTIERRVNELGVAEPTIARQGRNLDELLVQLPGVTDVSRAKAIIRSTGLLELKIVERGPASAREELMVDGQVPDGMEIVPGGGDTPDRITNAEYYLVRRAAAVSGRDLRNARPSRDQQRRPAVSFTLTGEGARKFGAATQANIGRQLAIILDNRVFSAPTIQSRITDSGQITGSFTPQEAQDLSLVLRSGALPASLTYLEERTIGPSLGADAIRSGVIASVVGLLLIVAFMLVFYKLSGVNAVVALAFNLIILLGLMAYVGAVMTLPGIAGFVLTMGIGVDSNVLIFERIKEELEAQRGVRAAINAGFNRVLSTLMDTHISALLAAAFLFQFGTGAIRGFAVTLSIGLVSNLFTSTFVSKTLFELVLEGRRRSAALSI